jgi:hypothetical protein
MKTSLLLAVCFLTLAGCASQIPIAANHPISTQKKAKAVHHWDLLAGDVTEQTVATLKKGAIAAETPLFVAFPPDNTPFSKAFRNLLITRMVNQGLPVTNVGGNAVELQYETQLVRHNSSRYAHIPGSFTALASGIWVLRDIATAGLPGAVAVAALADYGAGLYAGGAPGTELLVTSSIIVDKKYVMRKNDIYYIEDADVPLFVDRCKQSETCSQSMKVMEVSCGTTPCDAPPLRPLSAQGGSK